MQKEQDFQVVMLPTESGKEGAIWKFDGAKKLIASQGSLTSDIPFKEFHLYVVPKLYKNRLEPNEVIKAGDWFINGKDILLCDEVTEEGRLKTLRFPHITIKAEDSYKTIASTNKEITPNAIVPKSYVDFYVDKSNDSGVPFDYVSLKLVDWNNKPTDLQSTMNESTWGAYYVGKPQTTPNQEVIIDYFSGGKTTITITVEQAEDLYNLGRHDKVESERNGMYIDNSEAWIKKHIK